MDGTESQGTACASMDQITHLAKVRVAVSNPVFRSIVAGQTGFVHPEHARVLGSSGLNPSNLDRGAVGLVESANRAIRQRLLLAE